MLYYLLYIWISLTFILHIAAGYTDATGGDAYNLQLSEARAQAVRTALIAQGVALKRGAARVSSGL